MEYIHVKNLEKYHPTYKDRNLIWCKAYFTMVNSEPEFEMLNEIDKWRFMAFVMLELQVKSPIPTDAIYLKRKGFDLDARPISLTIKMLHNFIECVTEPLHTLEKSVPYIREDKSREDKNKIHVFDFESLWNKYPKKLGKKESERHFRTSVKTEQDFADIQSALETFLGSKVMAGDPQFIPHGSTWFNNWRDWLGFKEVEKNSNVPQSLRGFIK